MGGTNMRNEVKKNIVYIGCFVVFLIAGFFQGIDTYLPYPYDSFLKVSSNLLFFSLLIIWTLSIKNRIIQKSTRMSLLFIACCLFFWMILRFYKYYLYLGGPLIERIIWYLYYFPQLFVPPTMILVSLGIERKNNQPLKKYWYLLYLPAFVLFSFIITNEFHQLAFSIYPKTEYTYSYKHEIIYYLAIVWICLTILLSIIVFTVKSSLSTARKKAWIPVFTIVFAFVFIFINFQIGHFFYNDPELISFFCILIIESCIYIGLIPSNDNYANYFRISKASAMIADNDNEIVYLSNNSIDISKEQMASAIIDPLYLDENTILSSNRINGGNVFYVEDITEINELNSEMKRINEKLEMENSLIKDVNKLKEKEVRIIEQNKIYDSVSESIHNELNIVNDILKQTSAHNDDFEMRIRLSCLYIAYIKRLSNLIVSNYDNDLVNSKELEYALKESVDYLSLCGVDCSLLAFCEDLVPIRVIKMLYLFFQTCIIKALPSLCAIIVSLTINKKIVFRITCDNAKASIDSSFCQDELDKLGGSITIEQQDDTTYSTLSFDLGGDK